jgi:hypothetical protein
VPPFSPRNPGTERAGGILKRIFYSTYRKKIPAIALLSFSILLYAPPVVSQESCVIAIAASSFAYKTSVTPLLATSRTKEIHS